MKMNNNNTNFLPLLVILQVISTIVIIVVASSSSSSVVVSASSIPFSPSTALDVPPAHAFTPDDNTNYWKVFVGPSSATSNITQFWPSTASTSEDEEDATPRLFCLVPPWAKDSLSSPAPAPPPSGASAVTFNDPLSNFACATDTVQYANQGTEGMPFESCGSNSIGVSATYSKDIRHTIRAVNETQRSGGGCSPWRVAPIAKTFLDWNTWSDGAAEEGWSVTVGVRCNPNGTQGVAFAAVDDYLEPSSNDAIVTSTLNQILADYVARNLTNSGKIIDSSPVELDWPLSGIYNVYYSLYIDSRARTVLYASTVPVKNDSSVLSSFIPVSSSSDDDPNTKYVLRVLRFVAPPSLFDGNWHLLALVAEKTEGAFSTIRLFVDAATQYSGSDRLNYQRCVKDLSSVITPVRSTPIRSLIRNDTSAQQEVVYNGGAFSAFVGFAPPDLYDLQFHKVPLRAVELAGRGGNYMLSSLDLQGEVAFVIGSFVGLVGVGVAISAAFQVKDEVCDGGGGGGSVEEGDFGVATESASEGMNQLAAGASKKLQKFLASSGSSGGAAEKFQMMRKLTAVLAPLLQVFQSIALLFRGFSFPEMFEKPLTYVTFLFSFSFQLPEIGIELPSWTPLAMLGGIAFVALLIVLVFGWKDQTTFLETLKRYELFSKANSEYAAQAVLTFASSFSSNDEHSHNNTPSQIVINRARQYGKAIATNGWYLDESTMTELLPSVSPALAARLIKELGPKPTTTVEAIIRRVLLVTRGHSCQPEHARDVANLLLSGSAASPVSTSSSGGGNGNFLEKALKNFASSAEGAADDMFSTSSSSGTQQQQQQKTQIVTKKTRSLEDVTHCFRKAGLSCTDSEAELVMGELSKLSRIPSAVDGLTVSGRQGSSSSNNNHQKRYTEVEEMISSPLLAAQSSVAAQQKQFQQQQSSSTTTIPVYQLNRCNMLEADVLEALSAGEDASSGPSRDAVEKRAQLKRFRNRDLQLVINGPAFSGKESSIDIEFDSGKPWRETLKSVNHLATHGTCWQIERIKCNNAKVLYDCSIQMSEDKRRKSGDDDDGTEEDQREFFIYARPGTLASPPDPNTVGYQKFTLSLDWKNPLRCPVHDARLMKASDKMYEMLDEDKVPLFRCCFQEQPAMKLGKQLGPCRTDILYVCSGDEKCLYTFCDSCLNPSFTENKKIEYYTSWINLKRNPSSVISLISFLGLQSVYLPISQNALMILACHHSQLCEHPSCYSSITPEFMSALIVSGVSLILVTIGLPLYWFFQLRSRKKQVNSVFDSPTQWEEFLEQDETSLSNLYNKYEVDYIYLEPFLMVTRSLLLSAAVAVTEPESLAQMLAVAGITVFNTIFLGKTAPFIDPYIDILTKLDLWHSCFLVTFLCFDQASRIFLPGEDVLGVPMIIVTGVFFLSYGTVFYKTVISTFLDHRNLSKANELDREEQMWLNDDNIQRRLRKLKKVLKKKDKFFNPNHLQPVLTLAHMSQCTTNANERQQFLTMILKRFEASLADEYRRFNEGKGVADGPVLAQFTFRSGSWKSWSRGTGLQVLGEALRSAPESRSEKNRIKDFLHKYITSAKAEKSARSNAFSLLVAMRTPLTDLTLNNANLTGVFGRGAVLRNVTLRGCNAMSVNFTGSTFSNCDFTGSHLEGAQFGPEIKSQSISVWSSVYSSRRDESGSPRMSLNFDQTLIALSGFNDFFLIVHANSGHRLFVSDRYPTDFIKSRSDLKDIRESNFDETKAIFSPADPTLLLHFRERIFRYLPNYKTPHDWLDLPKEAEQVEFGKSGNIFYAVASSGNHMYICSTHDMVILHSFQNFSSQSEWPILAPYDDFTVICGGTSLSGEGADAGYVVNLVDLSTPVSKALAECRKNGASRQVVDYKKPIIDHRILHKFNAPEYLVFVSKDGKTFAQYISESRKCSVRSFVDLQQQQQSQQQSRKTDKKKQQKQQKGKQQQQQQQVTNTNNNNKSNKKIGASPGDSDDDDPSEGLRKKEKPHTNTICSFKIASGLDDPKFFQMPDGTSILVVAQLEKNNVGVAQLFSMISGRKIGQMYFSLKPPPQRVKDETAVAKMLYCQLDQSGTFLYVGYKCSVNRASRVEDNYISKIFLSFGSVAEKAIVKTVANDVRVINFFPDSTLLTLSEDMHARKLDVKNDVREVQNLNVSAAFDHATIHPVKPNLIATCDYSFVYMYDMMMNSSSSMNDNNSNNQQQYEIQLGKTTAYLPRNAEEGFTGMNPKDKPRPNDLKAWAKKNNTSPTTQQQQQKQPAKSTTNAKKKKKPAMSDSDFDDDDDDDDNDSDFSDDDSDDDSDDEDYYETEMESPTIVQFSDDGRLLAVGVNQEHEDIFLWDWQKKTCLHVLSRPSRANVAKDVDDYDDILSLIFLNNDQYVLGVEATEKKEKVVVFDTNTGVCLMECKVPYLTHLKRLNKHFLISLNEKKGIINLYSIRELLSVLSQAQGQNRMDPTLAATRVFPSPAFSFNCCISPDGSLPDSLTCSLNGSTIACGGSFGFTIHDFVFSPDGSQVVRAQPRLAISASQATPKFAKESAEGSRDDDSIALSPDGMKLALQWRSRMKIWDISPTASTPVFETAEQAAKYEMHVPTDQEVSRTLEIMRRSDNPSNNWTNIFGTEDGGWIFTRASVKSDFSRLLAQSMYLGKSEEYRVASSRRSKQKASGCWRRLETSAAVTRYLTDCIVDSIDQFASDPPPDALDHDVIDAISKEHESDAAVEYHRQNPAGSVSAVATASSPTRRRAATPPSSSSEDDDDDDDSDDDDDDGDSDDSDLALLTKKPPPKPATAAKSAPPPSSAPPPKKAMSDSDFSDDDDDDDSGTDSDFEDDDFL